MPPKGVAALTRACTLLGVVAPEATPAEEPDAPAGGNTQTNGKRDRKGDAGEKGEGEGAEKKGGGDQKRHQKRDPKRDPKRDQKRDPKRDQKRDQKRDAAPQGPKAPKGKGRTSGDKRKSTEVAGEDGTPWKKKQRKGKAQREAERERKKAAAVEANKE
jgi:hypothetical protein